ncbi:MAG: ParB N-terminal domain-containing protein [Candidatus Bathyarchaeia archaeon]
MQHTKMGGKDFLPCFGVHMVEMSTLKPHEKIDEERLCSLKAEIERDGVLKKPIVADFKTKVVLDGHHRIGALQALGCSKIPVIFVDYQSPKIGVKDWMSWEEYPKSEVVEAALKGELLPPKSTWHYIIFSKKIAHISKIQKPVNVPLKNLMASNVYVYV